MTVISRIISRKHFLNVYKQIREFSVTNNRLSDAYIIKSDSTDIKLPEPDLTIPEFLFSIIENYQNYIAVVSINNFLLH